MTNTRIFAGVFVSIVLFAAVATPQERKINRSDLPAAVEKTVAAQSHEATVRGFSREEENGQMFYEAELIVSDHDKDVLIDANGKVVEIEEQVEIGSLPAAVKDGLQARAGKGKLLKVESITKGDKLVAYEAKVMAGGKRSEAQVGPDGKPLDHEE